MHNNFRTCLDELDLRESSELTADTKKSIDFCQRVGLIGYILNESCGQNHNK